MKVTISQYARLCNVSRQAIEYKVYMKKIIPDVENIGGREYKFIDTDKYPPKEKAAN